MLPFLPQPKPRHKRNKRTARQRGAISLSTRRELHDRSNGACERCDSARATQAAHVTRRWRLQQTTLDDLIHLCVDCHIWADQTEEGREWLAKLREAVFICKEN